MENCIFCKIANGEIPSATLYEDDKVRMILDINPTSKGHGLILPKKHYANLYEIDEEILSHVIKVAKKAAVQMKEALHCDGVNILQNNEEAAGQSVFHYHMHVIPRYKNDNVTIPCGSGELTDEMKKELSDALKFTI